MALTRILLLGGGHTHLGAVARLAGLARAGADIALLAPSPRLLYSGMMPGWLAGQYAFDDCVIDLRRVCAGSGLAWIEDRAVGIDFVGRHAIGEGGRYPFDLVSINVGSANDLGAVDGGAPTVLGAKPFAEFVDGWTRWRAAARTSPPPRSLLVVGGGAAGVEIAFALAHLVRVEPALAGARVTLATAGEGLLASLAPAAARLARGALDRHGVAVRFDHRYLGSGAAGARFEGRSPIPADLVIVASGAKPPHWLSAAAARDGVDLAADGGLAVRADLRSTSHAAVFACGDCATVVDRRVPKSGVHALRQAQALAANLAASVGATSAAPSSSGEAPAEPRTVLPAVLPAAPLAAPASLARYHPRRWALALLNRCDGSAIGAWGPLGFAGRWVWHWKDRIDRRFIARFR